MERRGQHDLARLFIEPLATRHLSSPSLHSTSQRIAQRKVAQAKGWIFAEKSWRAHFHSASSLGALSKTLVCLPASSYHCRDSCLCLKASIIFQYDEVGTYCIQSGHHTSSSMCIGLGSASV